MYWAFIILLSFITLYVKLISLIHEKIVDLKLKRTKLTRTKLKFRTRTKSDRKILVRFDLVLNFGLPSVLI